MFLPIENTADNIQVCWDCDSVVNPIPPLEPQDRNLNVALYVCSDPVSNPFIHHNKDTIGL